MNLNNQNLLLSVHALSPLHAGIGQGVGAIDLPIAREVATGIPYLPGSSIKGVLRDAAEPKFDKSTIIAIFGGEDEPTSHNIGAVTFSDARLLLMPVRSLAGVFAWVTSPYLLQQFKRDAGLEDETIPIISSEEGCIYFHNKLVFSLNDNETVVLEDLSLKANAASETDKWKETIKKLVPDADYLTDHLCIVHDDVMTYLLETATDLRTRVSIDNEFKVATGQALWYEENLPAESLLYSLIIVEDSRHPDIDLTATKIIEKLEKEEVTKGVHQFGGKATVGRGLCSIRIIDLENTIDKTNHDEKEEEGI